MQLTLGQAVPVQTPPTVTSITVDRLDVDLNTGDAILRVDDGSGAAPQAVRFTLPAGTLATLQNFIKTKLATKLGTTVT